MTDDALARLYALCFPYDKVKWSRQDIAALEARPTGIVLRSEHGGAFLQVAADEGEILSIFIHPDQQGSGYGRALLARAIECLSAKGAKSVYLEVATENHQALGLYKREGFEQVGLRKAYYTYTNGMTSDAFILRKIL